MKKDALISEDGRYRYWLLREWDPTKPRMASFMLNPSEADAELDDPTIRRNIGYARAWGFGGLEVVNPFAFRSPSPRVLRNAYLRGESVVGPYNQIHIASVFHRCDRIMVGWGAQEWVQEHARSVLDLFPTLDFYAFKLSQSGAPMHPLYLPADLQPVLYRKARIAA